MLSFGMFQLYLWSFVVLGWIGVIIITFSSIREIIKLFKE